MRGSSRGRSWTCLVRIRRLKSAIASARRFITSINYRKPIIFFQGSEDVIVPSNQAEVLVEALRRKGKPVGYFLFSGEQHGFRKAANIQRSLEAELQFYAIEVFKVGLTF